MTAEAFYIINSRNEVIIIIKQHKTINKCGSDNAVMVITTAYLYDRY